MAKKGFVYLVGAGPGRADLITVRGAEVLKSADCVIYDKLVNPDLLNYAPADAEIIHVPKRTGSGSFTQEQINKLLIEKARSGRCVVRLKGGDPCIFARGAEEALLLAEAGIDFELIPGITAAIAAGEYAGIMLTNRNYSSQVVFVTGQEAEDKPQSSIDWHLLARFNGTIVFYMAVGNLDFIADELIRGGMAEGTPAAVIADATLPSQKVVKSSLKHISKRCNDAKISPPAVVVIGTAADCGLELNWFMKKPLFGKTIVVTRDEKGNADFAAKIIANGGNPLKFATIKIKPLTETNEFLQAIAKITEYDWLIFTSAKGVAVIFGYLHGLKKDARVFGSAKVAAIGSETAARLSAFGIEADFVPSVFTGMQLGRELLAFANLNGKKVLLLRSELASNELVELLRDGGAEAENVPVYTAVTEKTDCRRLIKKIAGEQVDWLTFASPSSVDGFFGQITPELVNSSGVKIASIGPITSKRLESLGLRVDITAEEHTIDGLLAAIKGTYE